MLDTEEAERREIQQTRYTSLDRILNRGNTADHPGENTTERFAVDLRNSAANARLYHLKSRLLFLEKLELAQSSGSNRWLVRSDFQTVLQAMQTATDRQRVLARHSTMLSDSRLPIRVTDARKLEEPLEGRVLGHVEDERTQRAYMILEGTDHHVHFIWHTTEIESARRQRKLAPDSFVRINPHSANGKTFLAIADLGLAEQILNDAHHIQNRAQVLTKRGIVPDENGWAGWVGRYDARLTHAAQQILTGQQRESTKKEGSEASRPQPITIWPFDGRKNATSFSRSFGMAALLRLAENTSAKHLQFDSSCTIESYM